MQTDLVLYLIAAALFAGYILVDEPPGVLERNYLDDAKYLADHQPLPAD